MIKKPPAPDVALLRAREFIEATPRAYVIHVQAPPVLPPDWKQQVFTDWMKACDAVPTLVRNNIPASVNSMVGPVAFVHPELCHLKPAPGIIIYGTAPWEHEETIRLLTHLGAALCRCLGQRTIELLFRGRVLIGRHD